MKKSSFVIAALVFLVTASYAQQWETPSYKDGDILVYKQEPDNGHALHRFGPVDWSIFPAKNYIDTVGVISRFKIDGGGPYPPAAVGAEPWTNTPGVASVYINDDGVAMKLQDGGYTFYPWFVARPPAIDTITVLDSVGNNSKIIRYSDFSTFDTTVFNTQVKALKYRQAGTRSTIIVAEKFGVVRVTEEGCQDCGWFLSSAVIDGVSYNYKLHTVNMPHVCPDFEARYEVKTQEGQYSTSIRTARDTTINGQQYFVYPMLGYGIFRHDNGDTFAFVNGKDTLVTPLEVSLGTLLGKDNMISDTFSIIMNDGIHFGFSFGWYGNDYAYWVKWLDGAGMYESGDWAFFYGTSYTRLLGYSSCGSTYTVTSVETPPQAVPQTSRIFSAPYPNPVSLSQGAVELATSQTITQPITIAVTDVLGRHVYTQRLNPTGPGTALRIPLRNIGPGLYYLSITGAAINETKKMVVVR